MARRIMIQGTMSGVGKSLLVTALCRILRQDGWKAAPFKSQNMALNSFVTSDGLEMGRAQAVQAQAAWLEPDVRMNPILLKPENDTGSQLIVNGRAAGHYSAREYFRMKKSLLPVILEAFQSLEKENDVIVIEGAGSPAEINLRADDIVNMGLAELVDAPVLLVGDIDRGGVFAQIYGTLELLEPKERNRVAGTVINKFRGDQELLRPGLVMLEEKTHVPVLGVVPYCCVDIDEEDSLSRRFEREGPAFGTDVPLFPGADLLSRTTGKKKARIAVIRLPRISNYTDFSPLERHPSLEVTYVTRPGDLGRPDLVILPGTKSTMGDLMWLRESGLEARIRTLAAAGTIIFGICGGYQMLGNRIRDPDGIEGGGEIEGLGLLPCETVFLPEKTTIRRSAMAKAAPFSDIPFDGYEIHMGKTLRKGGQPFACFADGAEEGCVEGTVFGTYLHGLFDSGKMVKALAAWLPGQEGSCREEDTAVVSAHLYQERQFDLLADTVRKNLNMEQIYQIM